VAYRGDPVTAEMRKDYARMFRDLLTSTLNIWRRNHEEGVPDRLGLYNPSQVIAQTHRIAWEQTLEYSVMHRRYASREHQQQQMSDSDLRRLELLVYWDAIETIAPAEWRPQFLGKPPPTE